MAFEVTSGTEAVHALLSGGEAGAVPPEPTATVSGLQVDELMKAPFAAALAMWRNRIDVQAALMDIATRGLFPLAMHAGDSRAVEADLMKFAFDHGMMLRHTMGKEGDPTTNPYAMTIVNLLPSYASTAGTNLAGIVEHLMRSVATLRALVNDLDGFLVGARADVQRLRDLAAKHMKPKDLEMFDAIVAEIEETSQASVRFALERMAEVVSGAEMLGLIDDKGTVNTLVLAEPAPAPSSAPAPAPSE